MAGETAKRMGERIRTARLEAGFVSQRHLADRMREIAREDSGVDVPVDNQRVSDWERGVNKPNDRYMELISKATGRDTGWFWRGDMKTPDLSLAEVRDEFRPNVDSVQETLDRIEQRLETAETERQDLNAQITKINELLASQAGILERIEILAATLPSPGEIEEIRRAIDGSG